MSYKIQDIEGIGPKYGETLAAANIANTADLLESCGSASGRKAVAETTGLSTKQLLEWANRADLMRIKGVGPQYADLLEAAGVDTVKELARRNAENLAAKMESVNDEKNLANATPSAKAVAGWVAAAGDMEPAISH